MSSLPSLCTSFNVVWFYAYVCNFVSRFGLSHTKDITSSYACVFLVRDTLLKYISDFASVTSQAQRPSVKISSQCWNQFNLF